MESSSFGSLNEISTGAPLMQAAPGGNSYAAPSKDIKGVRLFSLDNWHTWGSTDTLDQNKDVYLVKECETVLIGRAPQITKGTHTRPLPDNSWVLPCPVLSRSHAVLSLTKDQVLLSDAGSHHGIWRSWYGMMKRVQHNFPVLDGEVFTMGKQVEKHGKVHRPARIQIKFVYTDEEPLSASAASGGNYSRPTSNRYGLDDSDSMDMDCQDDFSDEDLYDDSEALKPLSPLACFDYYDPPQINDFSPSGAPPWRRPAPSQDSFFGADIVDTIPHSPPGAAGRRRVHDYPELHESSHAASQLSASEASYVPPHRGLSGGPLNATALTSLLNMESIARMSAQLQPFNVPVGFQHFNSADAGDAGIGGNMEHVTSDVDASASEEEDQDIDSYSESEGVTSIPYSTPPPLVPSPEPHDAEDQAKSPSPPGVTEAEASPLIACPTTIVEDAPDSREDVFLADVREPTPRSQSPPSLQPSTRPTSPRLTPVPQPSTMDVPPASADRVMSPPVTDVNARKRSREMADEATAQAEALAPPVIMDVGDAENTTAPAPPPPRPNATDAPFSTASEGIPAAAHDDRPPPAKRARLGTAAGFFAGAVAGSALTWAGLAYL